MGFNSTSIRKAARALVASAAIVTAGVLSGAAVAQTPPGAQSAAVQPDAQAAASIAQAVKDAVASHPGATAEIMKAAIQEAIAAAMPAGLDPQVANVTLASAIAQLPSDVTSAAGVSDGIQAEQQVVLQAAIVAAVQVAVNANQGATAEERQAAVEAAITQTINDSHALPAVAQLALTGASTTLTTMGLSETPGVQVALNNTAGVVSRANERLGNTEATGTIATTNQPNVTTPTTPTYVG